MTNDTTPETAHLTADVVLFGGHVGDLRVLAIRRRWDPFADCWALPGGHVDQGEQTIDAARRELAEETGLAVGILHPFGVYADPGRDPRGRYVTFAYAARVLDLPEPTPADGATDAQWIPVRHLTCGASGLAFDHVRIVSDALAVVLRWVRMEAAR